MKSGIFDSKGELHELPFYEIQGLCEEIVKTAIEKSEIYKEKYEEYQQKITRFSKEFEFCIHELGWMLLDPFCEGKEEVLFSNGERAYVASTNFVKKPGFNRHDIKSEKVGFPILTDENIKYNKDLLTLNDIENGIVDSRGYVNAGFMPSMNDLAQIILLNDLIRDKQLYEEYIEHKEEYQNVLEYVTSKENVIAVRKIEEDSYSIEFASENSGKVQDFIDALNYSGKLVDFKPLIQNEKRDIMKVA